MGENLFEEEFTMETLSSMGNPLERLSHRVDFSKSYFFNAIMAWATIRYSIR